MRWMSLIYASISYLIAASVAAACPLCQSETGQQVRDGIFDSQFTANLFAMVLPFVIIAGAVIVIHRGAWFLEPHNRSGPSRSRLIGGSRDEQ
jgi:hypothetical protein